MKAKWWWFSMATGSSWSSEEKWTRGAIYMLGVLIFAPVYAAEIWLLERVLMEERARALVGLFTCAPFALWLARQVCERVWPDYVKAADQKAQARMSERDRGLQQHRRER